MNFRVVLLLVLISGIANAQNDIEFSKEYYEHQANSYFITKKNIEILNSCNDLNACQKRDFVPAKTVYSEQILKNYFKNVFLFKVKQGLIFHSPPVLFCCLSKITGRCFQVNDVNNFNQLLSTSNLKILELDQVYLYLLLSNSLGNLIISPEEGMKGILSDSIFMDVLYENKNTHLQKILLHVKGGSKKKISIYSVEFTGYDFCILTKNSFIFKNGKMHKNTKKIKYIMSNDSFAANAHVVLIKYSRRKFNKLIKSKN
jgi:hypothetical protein